MRIKRKTEYAFDGLDGSYTLGDIVHVVYHSQINIGVLNHGNTFTRRTRRISMSMQGQLRFPAV